jgi:hypothetical protein
MTIANESRGKANDGDCIHCGAPHGTPCKPTCPLVENAIPQEDGAREGVARYFALLDRPGLEKHRDGDWVWHEHRLAEVARLREGLMKAVDGWELVARTQRELANDKRMPLELRASMIATSNAWMTAAHELKKTMEKAK